MRLLKFNNWISLNESAPAFDSSASYPDKTFGLPIGNVDSSSVFMGGIGGDWEGSMPRALWFGRVANDWAEANGRSNNLIVSQKRSKLLTSSGKVSDHFKGNLSSYAIDIKASGSDGDALLSYIMSRFGYPEYKGGSWFSVNRDGYRYQIGWKVPNHFDHIHIGVKKINSSSSPQIASSNKGIGAKLLSNPKIVEWFRVNVPEVAATLTADSLNNTLSKDPEHFEWFKKTFNLDENGDPIDTSKLSSKIKSKYSGEAASNIDLLINEIISQGVTNKYAIIGILSTIGKESQFIPRKEASYENTANDRIRKIFGSRVRDLTDDQLTKLKENPSKFWDRVYGPDDPTGMAQQYGNTQPGDGSKYLGRGFNGITFKANYKKYSDLTSIDIVSNPDLLNDPTIAAKVAVKFILTSLNKMGIDPNSFKNKREAVRASVQANAGSGKNIEGSETLSNAEKISNNLDFS